MRKRRAILYDDDAVVLDLLRDFFSLRHYDVLTYRKPVFCPLYGEISDCNNLSPCADIIMSDIRMPGQTGLGMLQAQALRGCRVPAENKAVMSGYLDDNEQRSVKALGCGFFQKPFLLDDISAWLDQCEERMDLSHPLGMLRREKRSSSNETIACLTPRGEKILTGIAVNTSPSGLCLKIDIPIEQGQTLMILPELPRASRAASVRWIKTLGDGYYMTGLRYV